MMKRTEYIIDSNGKHWLPSVKSRMEGMARYYWFKKKIGSEGITASEDKWQQLLKEYQVQILEETNDNP